MRVKSPAFPAESWRLSNMVAAGRGLGGGGDVDEDGDGDAGLDGGDDGGAVRDEVDHEKGKADGDPDGYGEGTSLKMRHVPAGYGDGKRRERSGLVLDVDDRSD